MSRLGSMTATTLPSPTMYEYCESPGTLKRSKITLTHFPAKLSAALRMSTAWCASSLLLERHTAYMLEIRRELQSRLARSCHHRRLGVSTVSERCQKTRTKE